MLIVHRSPGEVKTDWQTRLPSAFAVPSRFSVRRESPDLEPPFVPKNVGSWQQQTFNTINISKI